MYILKVRRIDVGIFLRKKKKTARYSKVTSKVTSLSQIQRSGRKENGRGERERERKKTLFMCISTQGYNFTSSQYHQFSLMCIRVTLYSIEKFIRERDDRRKAFVHVVSEMNVMLRYDDIGNLPTRSHPLYLYTFNSLKLLHGLYEVARLYRQTFDN